MTKGEELYRKLAGEITDRLAKRPLATDEVAAWASETLGYGVDLPKPDELETMGAPPTVIAFARENEAFWSDFRAWREATPITGALDRLQNVIAIFGRPCVWLRYPEGHAALVSLFAKLEELGPEGFRTWASVAYPQVWPPR